MSRLSSGMRANSDHSGDSSGWATPAPGMTPLRRPSHLSSSHTRQPSDGEAFSDFHTANASDAEPDTEKGKETKDEANKEAHTPENDTNAKATATDEEPQSTKKDDEVENTASHETTQGTHDTEKAEISSQKTVHNSAAMEKSPPEENADLKGRAENHHSVSSMPGSFDSSHGPSSSSHDAGGWSHLLSKLRLSS